jgi:hypothetical protein
MNEDLPSVTNEDLPSVTNEDLPSVTNEDLPSVTNEDLPSVTFASLDEANAAIAAATLSPESFSRDVDDALDQIEDQALRESIAEVSALQPDRPAIVLAELISFREKYLTLVDAVAADGTHPLASEDLIDGARMYARAKQRLAAHFLQLAQSLKALRSGEGEQALAALDASPTLSMPAGLEDVEQYFVSTMTVVSALTEAVIRESAHDFGGARAAYGRAIALARRTINELDPDDDVAVTPFVYQQTFAEAAELRSQHAQLLQQQDYRTAAIVARQAAQNTDQAVDLLNRMDPDSALMGALEGMASQCRSDTEKAEAEVGLEAERWDQASQHATRAQDYLNEAAAHSLRMNSPLARPLQERYLNDSFNYGIQFRRRLEREREAKIQLSRLRSEIKDLYDSLRAALAPAGITVTNQAEVVSSVTQQVDIVNQLEVGIRENLAALPTALEASNLPPGEAQQLATEASELAASTDSGESFFSRVGRFASRLASAAEKVGEVTGPVIAILQALQVLPG